MAAPSAHPESLAHPDEIRELALQIAELRERVQNLEKRLGEAPAESAAPLAPSAGPVPAPAFELPTGAVPVLGTMFLAIAGAYVLRSLTEWGVLPPAAGVAVGLVYGLIWLGIAARYTREGFAAAVNCVASVLIVAPLVWEGSQRLKVMPSGVSAAVLTGFTFAGLALAWKSRQRIIGTIAGASAMAMALALILARRDIGPFTVALLAMALATECAAWLDLRPGARLPAALAANASVLLFSWLMAGPRGMPETWVPVRAPLLLALQTALGTIYFATAAVQTVVRRRTLRFTEMFQTAAALLIGIGGVVWVFERHPVILLGLGTVALTGGVACYAISFRLFERENKWNFRAWATFGLLLVLTGIYLPFSRAGFWMLCCVSSIVCCWTARRFRLPTLGLHGAVYLALGAAAAGATGLTLQVLFGVSGARPEWPASIAILVAGMAAWAGIWRISPDGIGRWRNQISSLAIAAHLAWIAAGLAASAAVRIWSMVAGAAGAPRDTLGTVVLTGLSLAIAWLGMRWERRELLWLVYGLLAVGAYKLVVRDLVNEHNIMLVVSLLCYGGALIALPRMLRGKSGWAEN